MHRKHPIYKALFVFFIVVSSVVCSTADGQALREMRGIWLTTFSNIDWPKRGQSPEMQQRELVEMLNKIQQAGFNTVYMQVRSQCDAMYFSEIEPWSADLTGQQGKAPTPFWDPLQFAITEAHKRGLELHAWLNPYRAVANTGFMPYLAQNHIAKTNPGWLLTSGTLKTLDPGLPEVRQHILNVISDILNRYDVDGIHFDDYFYPEGTFNDNATFERFKQGFASKADWRRNNVDELIRTVHETIRSKKPWVKFGISPTGIYQNSANHALGTPTTGKQHFSELYSDSRKWIREGWVDYLLPQVYWYMNQPGSPFRVVTPWWNEQAMNRHIYIGLAGYKVGNERGWFSGSEIPAQIEMVRAKGMGGIKGLSVYNTASFLQNKLGYADSVASAFKMPALQPLMPWIDSTPPAPPAGVFVQPAASGWEMGWNISSSLLTDWDKPRLIAVYRTRDTGSLTAAELVGLHHAGNGLQTITVPQAGTNGNHYALTAIDRLGNESEPVYVSTYGKAYTKAPTVPKATMPPPPSIPEKQPVKPTPPSPPPVAKAAQQKEAEKTQPPIPTSTAKAPVAKVADPPAVKQPVVVEPKQQTASKPITPVDQLTLIHHPGAVLKISSGIRIKVATTGNLEYELFKANGEKETWGRIRSTAVNVYVLLPSTQKLTPGMYQLAVKKNGKSERVAFEMNP